MLFAANVDTYVRKPERVKAIQVREPKFITTSDGSIYFHPTDWLVIDSGGDSHRLENWKFKIRFTLELPPEGK